MGKKGRLHRERVIAGIEPPIRQETAPRRFLVCGKCHTAMPEAMVTDHLKECQPGGAECGHCHHLFPPEDFLAHFKGCRANTNIRKEA